MRLTLNEMIVARFGANYAMNAALGFTSVTSTTILSSMSGEPIPFRLLKNFADTHFFWLGFFTLGIGSCVGVESFTARKVGSVIVR